MKKIIMILAAAVCMVSCGNKDAQSSEQEAERVEIVSTMTLVSQPVQRSIQLSTNL